MELTVNDVAALTRLVNDIEVHDNCPFRTVPSELAEYFEPGYETESVGYVRDGRLIAYGMLRMPSGGGDVRFSGGVHPDHRGQGLGAEIMDWSVAAAASLTAGQEPRDVEVYVEEERTGLRELVEGMGFAHVDGVLTMRRSLDGLIEDVEIPAFFTIMSFAQLEPSLRDTYEEFVATSGTPVDPDFFVPEWSFVVLDQRTDRTQLAAYLLSNKYPQDWEVTGVKEGFTETVAVMPQYRGTHLASGLLARAAETYAADGMEYATIELDVDASRQSPILGLFEHLDYVPVRRTFRYTQSISDRFQQ